MSAVERIDDTAESLDDQAEKLDPQAEFSSTQRWGLALCFVGAPIAALSVGWSSIVWHFDELITARGQITVACTTVAALLIFCGVQLVLHAADGRRAARRQRERLRRLAQLHARESKLEERIARLEVSLGKLLSQQGQILSHMRGKNSAKPGWWERDTGTLRVIEQRERQVREQEVRGASWEAEIRGFLSGRQDPGEPSFG